MNLTLQTNPTQVAGLLAFAASTLACIWAARREHSGGWAALAAVHAALWLDILLNTRHRLHDFVNAGLSAAGLYESRLWLQALVLVEAISWHESGRVRCTHLGPLLLIAYAWLVCAAVVVWSALRR